MADNRLDKALRSQQRVLESALDLFGSVLPDDPRDLYGDFDGFQIYPPGGVPPYYQDNRGRGEVLPVYTTWQQLKYIRDRNRRLCAENEFAICAVENRSNYVVGDGFTYRATSSDGEDELVAMVQQVLDVWASTVEVNDYEHDGMQRLDHDGEFFLRFFKQDSGLLEMRFVEPEHVRDEGGDPYDPSLSFGVVTETDDVEKVVGYNVVEQPWLNTTPTFVPAEEMIHVKLNVPRNAKRGLPTFYPVERNLRRAEDLLASMTSMAKARAKIALIRRMMNVTSTAAANLVSSLTAARVTDTTTEQTLNVERWRNGTILNAGGNIDYEFPSGRVDAGSFIGVLQAELRAVAARLVMPEWMLTVDASNANFSSSMVAEAPAVKNFRRLQRMLARRFGESRHPDRKAVAWRQIEYAVELGALPPEVLTKVKIQCEGPSLESRNKSEEAQVNTAYYQLGIKSLQTIAQEQSLDFDQEQANRVKLERRPKTPGAGVQEGITEIEDLTGRSHGRKGDFTEPAFESPPAADDPNPEHWQTEYGQKTYAAKVAHISAQLDADAAKAELHDAIASRHPPEKLDALLKNYKALGDKAVKAGMEFKTSVRQLAAVTGGPIAPTPQEFDNWATHGPVGFISAGPNKSNPDHVDKPPEYFAEAHKALGEDLTAGGYKFAEIRGRYEGVDEPSYMVQMPDEHKHVLVGMGRKYGQEAVIHSTKGKNQLIYTTGPNAGQAHSGNGFNYTPDAEDMYSEYAGPDGKPIKFSLNFDFHNMEPMQEEETPAPADEPEEEPHLGDFVANRFAGKFPRRDGDDADDLHTETGFLLANGKAVQLGPPNNRTNDHREAVPSIPAMKRWGWPEDVVKHVQKGSPLAGLYHLMGRNGMVRFVGIKSYGVSLEHHHPLTHAQKRAVSTYAQRYKPEEIAFTRIGKNEFGDITYNHKIVPGDKIDDHLWESTDPLSNESLRAAVGVVQLWEGIEAELSDEYEGDVPAERREEVKKALDAHGPRLRKILDKMVKMNKQIGKYPTPAEVVAFHKALDAELQKLPEEDGPASLADVLGNHKHKLHALAGELFHSAVHGKPHIGHQNREADAEMLLGKQKINPDHKMTAHAGPGRRRFTKQNHWFQKRAEMQYDSNIPTVQHALNPGRAGGPAVVVGGLGYFPFPTEDSDGKPLADSDRAKVLARAPLADLLYDEATIAKLQRSYAKFIRNADFAAVIQDDFHAHGTRAAKKLGVHTLKAKIAQMQAALKELGVDA
jgi:hypothetical protein